MRLNHGFNTIRHKGKRIPTSVGNRAYESKFNIQAHKGGRVGYIPTGYAHRPDLISNVFYGTTDNWWLIMEVNNITDPFEGLNAGDKIIIP